MRISSTFTTDAIGRDFKKFSVASLVRCLWDVSDSGVPMCVSHDMLRPIGWNRPLAVYFEPTLTRVVGEIYFPETKDEKSNLLNAFNRSLHERLIQPKKSELIEIRRLLSAHLKGDEAAMGGDAAGLFAPNLAERCFPSIFEKARCDKDHLIDLNVLTPISPGIFQIGELLLFAHPFLRRSYTRLNSLNIAFLSAFQGMESESIQRKIRLDPDMVGLASSFNGGIHERSYWWGPSFNNSIPEIATGVYHRESTEKELYYHPVSATECFWYQRDGFYNFEAEELRDLSSTLAGEERYVCRYAHAMVPVGTSDPSHFDGAVRIYRPDEMITRLDSDLMRGGRNTEYVKLWRIDGKLSNSDWKKLLSDYYRDNTHVGEYLDGKAGEGSLAELTRKEHATDGPSAALVPYSLNPDDGLRVSLSFRPHLSDGAHGLSLLPSRFISVDGVQHPLLDADAVDFVKCCRTMGCSASISQGAYFEAFDDAYVALPVIMHGGEKSSELVSTSLKAIKTLLGARLRVLDDIVLAFSLRFPAGEKDAVISVAGHGQIIAKWLESQPPTLPTELDGLVQWSETVAESFAKGKNARNRPSFDDLLGVNGEMRFKRLILDESIYEFSLTNDELVCILNVPESQYPEVCAALKSGGVYAVLGSVSSDLKCSLCGTSYRSCECQRFVQKDAAVELSADHGMFAFWTDRPVI